MQVVAPRIGFCVKARNEDNRSVVYINLCQHSDVPEAIARPGAHNHSGESCSDNDGHDHHQDAHWEISYVLGPSRSHKAKDGSQRDVYDFIFGSRSLRRAQTDEQFRLVLLQTCYRALFERFNLKLDKKFTLVNKYAFKAPPNRQPLLQEIPSAAASSSLQTKATTTTSADYSMSKTELSASTFEYHVRIKLPLLDSSENSSLNLSLHSISFSAPDKYNIKIDLGDEVSIDVASGTSVFDAIARVLHVRFKAMERHVERPRKVVDTSERDHSADKEHHHHDTHEYTKALAASPPFTAHMVQLCGAGSFRQECFCRQTLRHLSLVVEVANASDLNVTISKDGMLLCMEFTANGTRHRVEQQLWHAVQNNAARALASKENIVVVLEKREAILWPHFAPILTATSNELNF